MQYREAGFSNWLSTTTSRTRKTIRNLNPSTSYEIRLRSRCDEGWTGYSPVYIFSTLSGRFNLETSTELLDDKESEPIIFNKLYPNPVSDVLTLDYELDLDGLVQINMFDLLGRSVFEQQQTQEEGRQKIQISVNNLTPGTYFLKISAKNSQIIRKFIKN